VKGLNTSQWELDDLLEKYQPDIICLQEVLSLSLEPNNYYFQTLRTKFNVFIKSGSSHKGGLVTAVRRDISGLHKISMLDVVDSEKLELLIILLESSGGTNLLVYNVYFPRGPQLPELACLTSYNLENAIILGDFNARS